MTTVVPTYADIKWGPEPWAYLDYYANATRVPGGNPLLFVGNAGGSEVGSHRYFRDSSDTAMFHTLRWLLDGQFDPNSGLPQNSEDFQGTSPSAHYDVCAVTTAQRKHTVAVIPRSQAIYYPGNVLDVQRCIALVKRKFSALYGFDPARCLALGESFHGWAFCLSQLGFAPFVSGDFDSTLRGVLSSGGPVDFRNGYNADRTAGGALDYFYFSRIASMMGVRSDISDEWDAFPVHLKNEASIRYWFEKRRLAGYPSGKGFYTAFVEAGDHLCPIGDPNRGGSDPHDSAQVDDLDDSMEGAGLVRGTDFESEVITDGTDLSNDNYPLAPSGTQLTLKQRFSAWMDEQAPEAA